MDMKTSIVWDLNDITLAVFDNKNGRFLHRALNALVFLTTLPS